MWKLSKHKKIWKAIYYLLLPRILLVFNQSLILNFTRNEFSNSISEQTSIITYWTLDLLAIMFLLSHFYWNVIYVNHELECFSRNLSNSNHTCYEEDSNLFTWTNCKAKALTTKVKTSQKCQGQGLTKQSRPRPRFFTQRPRHFGQGQISLMMDITNIVLHAKLSVQLLERQIFKHSAQPCNDLKVKMSTHRILNFSQMMNHKYDK